MITEQQIADQIAQESERIGICLARFDSVVLPDTRTAARQAAQPRYRVLKTRREEPVWRPMNAATVRRFKEDAFDRNRRGVTLFAPTIVPNFGFPDAPLANVIIWNLPDGGLCVTPASMQHNSKVPIKPLIRCFHVVYLANGDAPDANPNCTLCQIGQDERNAFYEQHMKRIERYVRRMNKQRYDRNFVKTVVNDVLYRLCKTENRDKIQSMELRPLKRYLFVTVESAYKDELKKRKRIWNNEVNNVKPHMQDEGEFAEAIDRPLEEDCSNEQGLWYSDRDEKTKELEDGMKVLPVSVQEIMMAYLSGETQSSIAARLGVSQQLISKIVNKVRKMK